VRVSARNANVRFGFIAARVGIRGAADDPKLSSGRLCRSECGSCGCVEATPASQQWASVAISLARTTPPSQRGCGAPLGAATGPWGPLPRSSTLGTDCPLWPWCHTGGRTTPTTRRQLGRPPSPRARYGRRPRCKKDRGWPSGRMQPVPMHPRPRLAYCPYSGSEA
jgi:hypothetical protein